MDPSTYRLEKTLGGLKSLNIETFSPPRYVIRPQQTPSHYRPDLAAFSSLFSTICLDHTLLLMFYFPLARG